MRVLAGVAISVPCSCAIPVRSHRLRLAPRFLPGRQLRSHPDPERRVAGLAPPHVDPDLPQHAGLVVEVHALPRDHQAFEDDRVLGARQVAHDDMPASRVLLPDAQVALKPDPQGWHRLALEGADAVLDRQCDPRSPPLKDLEDLRRYLGLQGMRAWRQRRNRDQDRDRQRTLPRRLAGTARGPRIQRRLLDSARCTRPPLDNSCDRRRPGSVFLIRAPVAILAMPPRVPTEPRTGVRERRPWKPDPEGRQEGPGGGGRAARSGRAGAGWFRADAAGSVRRTPRAPVSRCPDAGRGARASRRGCRCR